MMFLEAVPIPVVLLWNIWWPLVDSLRIIHFPDNKNTTKNTTYHFKIGLLAPWNGTFDDFSALTSASAVAIAIEDIHNDPSLANNIRFSVVTLDSSCHSKIAAGNAVRMYIEEQVDAFIGPPCSIACRPVAQLASSWDKPLISWVAIDPDFDNRDIYTTMARTLGPFNKIGTYLLQLFEQYEWHRVVVISSRNYTWEDAGQSIRKVFIDNNITIAYESKYDDRPQDYYIRRALLTIKNEGRIVVLVVPKEDRRRFMLMAHDLDMTMGDYVFLTLEMMPEENFLDPDEFLRPEDVWMTNDSRDSDAKQAFESVFHVTLAGLSSTKSKLFRQQVARRMRLPPWNHHIPDNINMKDYGYSDRYSPFLYDAVLLYAMALNETLNKKENIRSGTDVVRNMKRMVFKGMSGNVLMDNKCDREPHYWITDMVPSGKFVPIAEVLNTDNFKREFHKDILPPRWPGGKIGHEWAPPDTPMCGFRNELCDDSGNTINDWLIMLYTVLAAAVLVAIVGLFVVLYRRYRFETELLQQSWKVKWEDITPVSTKNAPSALGQADTSDDGEEGPSDRPIDATSTMAPLSITNRHHTCINVATFKGITVSLKHIKKEHVQITRQLLLEFNEMKDIVHENINVFVGACVDPPNICLMWDYCSKGSLYDILHNSDVKLDISFKLSFMTDIAKGMEQLHKSVLHSHGNLKSRNCVIDQRWTVKITDFGLPSFIEGQITKQDSEETLYKSKLWTAPELLRELFSPPRGTQKGDVYGFAIICYEIIMRTEPYNFDNMTPRDVLLRVRNGESNPHRPNLISNIETGSALVDLVKQCWKEDPEERPSFSQGRAKLRNMTNGEINIMDNVLSRMEKYTSTLEEIVEERTRQLLEEKKRTDRLLYRMLPSTVAEQLKQGKYIQPENYDQSTIYFSDIVDFTTLAAESTPIQIVNFLNDLYSCFDQTINAHDVYKVETIGDAYMVVSGVPVRNGQRHIVEIANCALDLLSTVTLFKIRHRPQNQLQLRIGLHTGPVVAGVVGNTMPRYCLFGDAVNMAARMESSGKRLRIHISKVMYIALNELGGYQMALRGELNVKGKGWQTTYWLYGKQGYNNPLPPFFEPQEEPERLSVPAITPLKHITMTHMYGSTEDAGPTDSSMPPVL